MTSYRDEVISFFDMIENHIQNSTLCQKNSFRGRPTKTGQEHDHTPQGRNGQGNDEMKQQPTIGKMTIRNDLCSISSTFSQRYPPLIFHNARHEKNSARMNKTQRLTKSQLNNPHPLAPSSSSPSSTDHSGTSSHS